MAIHSSGQTIFSLAHIEGITLGAGEVAGGASAWVSMGSVRLVTGLVNTGVYGEGFTAGSLAGKRTRGGTRGTGNKVSSDKELMEVGRMA